MAGGLLNIVAYGNANVILNGNPSKTFFTATYSKYTNFGLQKFRIDYEGLRDLRTNDVSKFTFKMKRYADLLMDTYVVVTLPDIWSPIYNPTPETGHQWVPYEFNWINCLGTNMIKEIEITCGSVTLQKYTGEYLYAMMDRDFSTQKIDLFDKMTGNTIELNDPANAYGNDGDYPSAFYTKPSAPTKTSALFQNTGAEPSIRGRQLYIPINSWFTLDSKCAFPLVSLQYNEVVINVTVRPIQELFQVRDIFDVSNNFQPIRPDFTKEAFQLYRFLQTPPDIIIDTEHSNHYKNKISSWNADVHLIATYCFLSKEEAQLFAANDQVYLVKDVMKYDFQNITGSHKVKLQSNGLVSNWMFLFKRDDAYKRNEWSNYTNWPYLTADQPSSIISAPGPFTINDHIDISTNQYYGPGVNLLDISNQNYIGPTIPYNYHGGLEYVPTDYMITGPYSETNRYEILNSMGIIFDGDYRENILDRGIYDYVEKYTRTQGYTTQDGVYCYNFCLNTSPFEYQPTGAINLNKFNTIELEINTITPPVDLDRAFFTVACDIDGNPISVTNKPGWDIYEYNYDLTVYEERYNIISFIGGNCGLLYAR
jgi:hypothetical protein